MVCPGSGASFSATQSFAGAVTRISHSRRFSQPEAISSQVSWLSSRYSSRLTIIRS